MWPNGFHANCSDLEVCLGQSLGCLNNARQLCCRPLLRAIDTCPWPLQLRVCCQSEAGNPMCPNSCTNEKRFDSRHYSSSVFFMLLCAFAHCNCAGFGPCRDTTMFASKQCQMMIEQCPLQLNYLICPFLGTLYTTSYTIGQHRTFQHHCPFHLHLKAS